jgi:cytochrome c oxidase cbb3-type subunit 3
MQKVNDSVPIEDEKSIELDHNYDGIKELDNHLPPWWKWLFYGSMAWAVVYMVVFHITDTFPLSLGEYQNEVAVAEQQIRIQQASQPETVIDENSLVYSFDAAIIESGKKVFMDFNCGACHRNDGGGNVVGPNLTDAYWIHGGDIKDLLSIIKNGAVEKGMPAWGKSMSPENVRDVSFFVMSLQGSNPVDAKAPQGELFQQPEPIKGDSTNIQASR